VATKETETTVTEEGYDEVHDVFDDRPRADDRPTLVHEDHHAEEDAGTVARWGPWSPAQMISGVIGMFLTVMGGIALARIGLGDLTSPDTTVFGFGHTPLMGLIEVALGLLLMLNAASAFASRGMLIGLGAIAAAFGLIVVFEPGAFQESLGVARNSGWLFLGIGAGAVVLGSVSPVFTKR
jgi:hypothetical protein